MKSIRVRTRFHLSVLAFAGLAASSLILLSGMDAARYSDRGWNGIVPLHSTRSDVEKRLGEATTECHCAYSTSNEAIVVRYSSGHCKGPPYGWNVPTDTVLEIKLFPKQQTAISESKLLAENYIKSREIDGPTVYYTNVELGIKHTVNNGMVNSVSYMPSSNDVNLRCSGFPAYTGGLHEYHPYAVFSSKAKFIDERLYQFGAQLSHNPGVKGYIVTYAGRIATNNQAKRMAESAKRQITQAHHGLAGRITAIGGGFRETAEYELFLIPSDWPAPSPTPTVASNQVRVLRRSRTK